MKKILFSLIILGAVMGISRNAFADITYSESYHQVYPTMIGGLVHMESSYFLANGLQIKHASDGLCTGEIVSSNFPNDFDIASSLYGQITGWYELCFPVIPANIYDHWNAYGIIYWDGTDGYPDIPETIGITHSTPVNQATDVNAFATFTGTYDNDGTYNIVYYNIHNYDCTNCEDELLACVPAEIGTEIGYSCDFSLATNTHYGILPRLVSTTLMTSVLDSEGPYDITTGLVYEVAPPMVSSTCGALDVGCYLQNAISWTFGIKQETLNRFASLTLENSLPFSYIYDMGNLYGELFDDTAQDIDIAIAFGSFGNITLLSTDQMEAIPFQGTVRTILGALMIFGTAMLLYGKIMGIHDSTASASATGQWGDSRPWH